MLKNKITSQEVKKRFLGYFSNNNFKIENSISLIPHNDPSLLFVNAGMVAFKDYFIGNLIPEYQNVCSVQKCVRAGGKHNDLENVGLTTRHHTFFEMLGNFSFGDCTKRHAIKLAWDFLTTELMLVKERLHITYFHEDLETRNIWLAIGVEQDKLLAVDTDDNFWAMGKTGPCGPCTEIYYDHGEEIEGTIFEGDRFVEVWNIVFIQFNTLENGERINLSKLCIDTGIGLERLTAVLNGSNDNYTTNIINSLILKLQDIFGNTIENEIAYRIIADHIRSISFLIADGVIPSNNGRGYVLRRIIRRAVKNCYILQEKNKNAPLVLSQLLPTLQVQMGTNYQELITASDTIKNIMDLEENSFKKTIDKGYNLIDGYLATHNKISQLVDGKTVFKLYDTYGFPVDLTQLIFAEHGLTIDEDGFNKCMANQREMARKSWLGSGETKDHEIYFSILNDNGISDFLGYHQHECQTLIVAIIKNNQIIEEATTGMTIELILSQTVFYSESGGQKGDKGTATNKNCTLEIYDTTKKVGKLHVHHAKIISGALNKEAILDLKIDDNYRHGLEAGHSATHLLNDALLKVVGSHITQQGSMINDKYFTFDFNHHKPINNEQLNEIETYINKEIILGHEVKENFMDYDKAVKIGAISLPGEIYHKKVRVIEIGKSLALCGGTHIENSSMIGFVKIANETSIAAGIRRITVYTGQSALNYLNDKIYNLESKIKLLEAKNKENKQEYNKDIEKLNIKLYNEIPYKHINKHIYVINSKILPDNTPLNIMRNLASNDLATQILILISYHNKQTSIIIKVATGDFIATKVLNLIDGIKGGGNSALAQGVSDKKINIEDIIDIIDINITQ